MGEELHHPFDDHLQLGFGMMFKLNDELQNGKKIQADVKK